MCNPRFYHLKTFNFYDESEEEYWLKYWFDLKIFAVDKFPDDGTLVPKPVGVST
jgi:hypothetical protein